MKSLLDQIKSILAKVSNIDTKLDNLTTNTKQINTYCKGSASMDDAQLRVNDVVSRDVLLCMELDLNNTDKTNKSLNDNLTNMELLLLIYNNQQKIMLDINSIKEYISKTEVK